VSLDRVRKYYDRVAPYYDLTRLPFLLGRARVVSHLDLKPGHHVLEIGAGTGHNIRPILNKIGDGRLTLLDFSDRMLRKARSKFPSHGQVRYVASDASHFHLRTQFDRILFSYSLSLVPDPVSVLRTARKHLSQDGHISIVDFGPMAGWGPVCKAIRWWLDKHSVVALDQEIGDFLSEAPGSTVDYTNLGYTLLARITV
jgi:S-adenosylmethionine-diacylgycerolhomoserine-N-methlytransferase